MQTYYPILWVSHPEVKKKKELVLIPLIFFCPFFTFLVIYLFLFFSLSQALSYWEKKKRGNAVTIIIIIIRWLTFQEQEKSYLEKVVVNGVIRSGFLVPKACEVLCVKFYGRIVPKMR